MTILNIKKVKAITNGQRNKIKLTRTGLIKNARVIKNLTAKKITAYGRNNGQIVCRHKQRGKKRAYKLFRDHNGSNIASLVLGVVYDPNRNGLVNLNWDFFKQDFFYSLCSEGVHAGSLQHTCTYLQVRKKPGYRGRLKYFPIGAVLNNIGPLPGSKGSQVNKGKVEFTHSGIFAKAAGASAIVLNNDKGTTLLRLPSNKIVMYSGEFMASIGKVSNRFYRLCRFAKAGYSRNIGKRPKVRGRAMNAVDHPMGGSSSGICSVSPWGLPTKCGYKKTKKTNNQKTTQNLLYKNGKQLETKKS